MEQLTKSNDEDVAKRHKIDAEFLKTWIANYKSNHKVAHILKDIEDLTDQVFV